MDKDTASAALAQVEAARQRAITFRRYAKAGPIFAVWGVTWLCGNLAHYFDLPYADIVTAGLGLVPITLSITLGRASAPADTPPSEHRKALLGGLVFGATVMGLMLIIAPADPRAASAAISFLVAAIYTFAGLWMGARIGWLGLLVALVILMGWFGAREHFELWAGLGGGGLLLVTGLWLWRQ